MFWKKKRALPPRPAGFDPKAFDGMTSEWHQKWEVFDGVWTPGRNPVNDLMDKAHIPADLAGKRVLDVGAFNGCFSFECERRGAAEVVALDLPEPEAWGFAQLKALLGSRVQYVQGSSYRLDPAVLGTFDVVLFFGVLYHLRYPLLAMDQLRRVCSGVLYFETMVTDDSFMVRGERTQLRKLGKDLADASIWQFYPGGEYADDVSNWFGPTIRAVLDGLKTAGFQAQLTETWGDRAAFTAAPCSESLPEGSYEQWSSIARRDAGLE